MFAILPFWQRSWSPVFFECKTGLCEQMPCLRSDSGVEMAVVTPEMRSQRGAECKWEEFNFRLKQKFQLSEAL